jgi:hypothetical protein
MLLLETIILQTDILQIDSETPEIDLAAGTQDGSHE